jgi:hypothetical protein
MLTTHRLTRLLAAGAVCAAAVGTLAAPASAGRSMNLVCNGGGGDYLCSVFFDASHPYTVRWYVNGHRASAFDDEHTLVGACPTGATVGIKVVIDEGFGPNTRTAGVKCYEHMP